MACQMRSKKEIRPPCGVLSWKEHTHPKGLGTRCWSLGSRQPDRKTECAPEPGRAVHEPWRSEGGWALSIPGSCVVPSPVHNRSNGGRTRRARPEPVQGQDQYRKRL